MKKITQIYMSIALLGFFSFSCSLFFPSPTETPPPPPTEIIQPPTPVPSPTEEVYTPILPVGIVTEKDGVLSLFDREGYTLAQVNAPGISSQHVHIAGNFPAGSTDFPVIYFSIEQNNSLFFSDNGQITTLLSTPNFSGMVGAAGKPVIAYSTIEYGETVISDLYAGTRQSLPLVSSVLNSNDAEGWGLLPLAVDVDTAGQPSGIWYTKRPSGIGGDIVFEPRLTLFHLDLISGQSAQILGTDANPSAISANRKWVAYTSGFGDTVMGNGTMTVRNIETGESFSYPLQAAVDQRGSGEASFSPSNQYIAWMEGKGFQLAETPDFHSTIRIGDLKGNIIAEVADMSLSAVSGLSLVSRVEPVGWLDDNTLLVMAYGEGWDEAVVLLIDLPSQTPRLLAQGTFIELVYP